VRPTSQYLALINSAKSCLISILLLISSIGGLLGDLNLEGLDAAQMDDIGGVTDEIMAAQMEILTENEVSNSG
jgi:hypothetical protein